MSRSTKKGPFIDPNLAEKVDKAVAEKNRRAIRTYARASTISPKMVGLNVEVHNGRNFTAIYITDSMVGHKLGEFAPTRRFSGHSKKGKIAKNTGFAGRAA